jgi:hypothetical protein
MKKTYKLNNKAMVSVSTQEMKALGYVVLGVPLGIGNNNGEFDWLGLIKMGVINKEMTSPSIDNLENINYIIKNIQLINKKGFVNNPDIENDTDFPILAKYIEFLIKEKKDVKELSLLERIDLGK